jgi:hypothetical protein
LLIGEQLRRWLAFLLLLCVFSSSLFLFFFCVSSSRRFYLMLILSSCVSNSGCCCWRIDGGPMRRCWWRDGCAVAAATGVYYRFFSSQCRGAFVFCTFLFFLLLQADLRWLLLLTIKRKNGTAGYGSRRWFSFFLCFCVASSVCFCSPVALVSAAPSSVSDDGRAAIVGGAAGDKAE